MNKIKTVVFATLLMVTIGGCANEGDDTNWHEVSLASGRKIKVKMFTLAFANEHGDRDPSRDGFNVMYVESVPATDTAKHEAEARELFELVRPTADLWKTTSASLTAWPNLKWEGKMVIYSFTREASGNWAMSRFYQSPQ